MSSAYSITFFNNTSQPGTVCLYQQNQFQPGPNIMSLAWFTWFVDPNDSVKFEFTIDYSFFWAESGTLVPGVTVIPGQTVAADLYNSNSITLSESSSGSLQFGTPQMGPQSGSLYIQCNSAVPPNLATVGIGMSGSGTFAVQAQPNYTNIFTPHPTYWLTFGNYNTGEVLDTYNMNTNTEVSFPANVYAMEATLNANYTFTVQPVG